MHWYYKIACIVITNWQPVTAVGRVLDNTADSVIAVQPGTLAREDGFWNKKNYSYYIAAAAFVYCLKRNTDSIV